MDLGQLQEWTDRYVEAWTNNDREAIGALFSEDAVYYTHPFRDPWKGREAIVEQWSGEPDAPDSWRAEYRALAATEGVGVIRGHTEYLADDGSVEREYANVFVAEFDSTGRCKEFAEFFMKKPEK